MLEAFKLSRMGILANGASLAVSKVFANNYANKGDTTTEIMLDTLKYYGGASVVSNLLFPTSPKEFAMQALTVLVSGAAACYLGDKKDTATELLNNALTVMGAINATRTAISAVKEAKDGVEAGVAHYNLRQRPGRRHA